MNTYCIEFHCSNGYNGEVYVDAACEESAMMLFEDFEYEDVVWTNCYKIDDDAAE